MSAVAEYSWQLSYHRMERLVCLFKNTSFQTNLGISGRYLRGFRGIWSRLVIGEKTSWLEADFVLSQTHKTSSSHTPKFY